nr:MAG TPA_asm: hypothetical protein [Caudoviricetes sp.]
MSNRILCIKDFKISNKKYIKIKRSDIYGNY